MITKACFIWNEFCFLFFSCKKTNYFSKIFFVTTLYQRGIRMSDPIHQTVPIEPQEKIDTAECSLDRHPGAILVQAAKFYRKI